MDYTVYILRCKNSEYYVGITNDLDRRLSEHQRGIHPQSFTHNRRPVTLVFSSVFSDVHEAITFEKQVKGWSRAKKEALIRQEYEKLPELSMNTLKKARVDASTGSA